MHPRYFKNQICEELEGAADYLKHAIDTMKSNPEWSEKFRKMADMEQHHATCLYKMFVEMYTESQGKDEYMTSMRDAIMDCFSKQMRQIEDYKTTYDMMVEKTSIDDDQDDLDEVMEESDYRYTKEEIPKIGIDFG